MINNNQRKEIRYSLIMTEACNLNCKYCYVNHNSNEKISKKVLDGFIDMVYRQLMNNLNIDISIDIFGGEPLLAWEEVQYLINQSNKKLFSYKNRVRFVLFSNAILFTEEKLKFLKQSQIYVSYNFSVDGNKTCHNSARVYKNGKGSWDDVLKGIEVYKKVYQKDEKYFPVTKFMVSSDNIDYILDITKDMAERTNRLSLGLVREGWDDESVQKYEKNMTELAEYYIKNIDKKLWIDLFLIPIMDKQNKRNKFCSAGTSSYGIAPNGDIYPCQRFYNNRSPYKLGNVFTGLEKNNKWRNLFENYTSKNIVGCNNCKTIGAEHCTGFCIAALYEENHNIFIPNKNVCKIININYQLAHKIYEELKDNSYYQECLNIKYYGG